MHPFNDLQPTNEGFPWTFRLGALLGGHVPTKSAVNSLLASSRRAVKSSPGGHESAHLQQMLLLGHCSDLLYVSVQRALRALHKWRNRHPYFPNLVNSSLLQCLGRAVCRLGGSVVSPGSFRFGDFTWDTTTPFGFAPNFAHCLRQFWRASLFNRWLGSSRRDAVLARSTGLSSSMSLIDRLRGVAQTIDGHSRQIMAGGLTTEAHSSPIPTDCSCCNQAVVPGTDHILWSCPTFDSYRRYSRPPDELEARLGWGQNGPKQHLIIQTGQIRAVYAEESVRLKKAVKFRQDSAVCIFTALQPDVPPLPAHSKASSARENLVPLPLTGLRALETLREENSRCQVYEYCTSCCFLGYILGIAGLRPPYSRWYLCLLAFSKHLFLVNNY